MKKDLRENWRKEISDIVYQIVAWAGSYIENSKEVKKAEKILINYIRQLLAKETAKAKKEEQERLFKTTTYRLPKVIHDKIRQKSQKELLEDLEKWARKNSAGLDGYLGESIVVLEQLIEKLKLLKEN